MTEPSQTPPTKMRPPRSHWLQKLFKVTVIGLLVASIVLIILVNASHWFTPWIMQHSSKLETWASTALQRPVVFEKFHAKWVNLNPEFTFGNVKVYDKNSRHVLIGIQHLDIQISVIDSLLHLRLEPAKLSINGAQLAIWHNTDESFSIDGYHKNAVAKKPFDNSTLLGWLLSDGRLHFEDLNITFHTQQRNQLPIKITDIEIHNSGLHHVLSGRVVIANAQKTHLYVAMDVNSSTFNETELSGQLYVHAKHVDLASSLFADNPLKLQVQQGLANIEIWSTLHNNQFIEAQSRLKLSNVKLVKDKNPLVINEGSTQLSWIAHRNHQWHLSARHLQITINGKPWPESRLILNASQLNQQGLYKLLLQHGRLRDLLWVLRYTNVLTKTQNSLLAHTNPTATLENLRLSWPQGIDFKNFSTKGFALETNFTHLSNTAWQKIPGVSQLNGHIQLTEKQGFLRAAGKNTQINFGRLFKKSLPLQAFNTEVVWENQQRAWVMTTKTLTAENADAKASGTLTFTLPKNAKAKPRIDLDANATVSSFQHVGNYLPLPLMPKGLVAWLSQAVVKGKQATATLKLHGALSDFPYTRNQGVFVVDGQVHDLTLRYRRAWPVVQHLDANLHFSGRSMKITAQRGSVFNARLIQATASAPYLGSKKPTQLTIQGKLAGNLADGLRFIAKSPLRRDFGGNRIDDLAFDGPMKVNLLLSMHFQKNAHKLTVKGEVNTTKGTFNYKPQHIVVKQLAGNIDFTEKQVSGHGLKGHIFDNPVTINLATLGENASKSFNITADGQAAIAVVRKTFNFPILKYANGKSAYHFMMRLYGQPNQNKPDRLQITSQLQGISTYFPGEFAKSAKSKTAFYLQNLFLPQRRTLIRIRYGDKVSAALLYNTTPRRFTLQSGAIHFGKGMPNTPKQRGLLIDGNLSELNWSAWQPFLASNPLAHPDQKLTIHESASSALRRVHLKIARLEAFGQRLANATIDLSLLKKIWLVNLDSPQAQGKIWIPAGKNPKIIAKLQRFNWLPSTKFDVDLKPNTIPNLTVDVHQLFLRNRLLGELALQTIPINQGITIKKLRIESKNFELTANGRWNLGNNQQHVSSFNGTITSYNVGQALNAWSLSNNIAEGKGRAQFTLNWAGPPLKPRLTSLNGNVSIESHNGRVVGLSPSTKDQLSVGRVLTLFSLKTIARRMSLDFSDLTNQGYAFNIVKGDFAIRHGDATTNNAYLDGPVAYVGLKGRIGLAKKDYDLRMEVVPYVTSSLPVVATIAGGPLVGALTWAADRVLGPELHRITAHVYQVSGSWSQPHFQELEKFPSKRRRQR